MKVLSSPQNNTTDEAARTRGGRAPSRKCMCAILKLNNTSYNCQ